MEIFQDGLFSYCGKHEYYFYPAPGRGQRETYYRIHTYHSGYFGCDMDYHPVDSEEAVRAP